WYSDEFLERTRNFMSRAAFYLSNIDEPQLVNKNITFYTFLTKNNISLFGLHGMNSQGMQAKDKELRKKITL
ncbi:DUF72 domain-containing protein, partial [Enterococcus faecium]